MNLVWQNGTIPRTGKQAFILTDGFNPSTEGTGGEDLTKVKNVVAVAIPTGAAFKVYDMRHGGKQIDYIHVDKKYGHLYNSKIRYKKWYSLSDIKKHFEQNQ